MSPIGDDYPNEWQSWMCNDPHHIHNEEVDSGEATT